MLGAVPDSFDDLLARARRGDETAFTLLFRQVQPGLLRYLSTMRADADDVAAETWVHVVRGLDKFSGDEQGFRRWVFTIARSRMIDARRIEARRKETPTDAPPDVPAAVDIHLVVEEMISTESALALLRQLPSAQAEVLLLRVVAGLDVAGTAAVLGRSANHVRVLAHRGLRALAELVDVAASEISGRPL